MAQAGIAFQHDPVRENEKRTVYKTGRRCSITPTHTEKTAVRRLPMAWCDPVLSTGAGRFRQAWRRQAAGRHLRIRRRKRRRCLQRKQAECASSRFQTAGIATRQNVQNGGRQRTFIKNAAARQVWKRLVVTFIFTVRRNGRNGSAAGGGVQSLLIIVYRAGMRASFVAQARNAVHERVQRKRRRRLRGNRAKRHARQRKRRQAWCVR